MTDTHNAPEPNEETEGHLDGLQAEAEFARPGIGHNRPPLWAMIFDVQDFGAYVTENLQIEHSNLAATIDEIQDEARALPDVVEDEDNLSVFAASIKRHKDSAANIEALRVGIKERFLRACNSVDAYFFGLSDRLIRPTGSRGRSARPGSADVLQTRVDTYMQEKLRREQEERRRREAEERRRAEEARRREEDARRAQQQADARAARARTEETRRARQAEADAAAAAAASAAAAAETAVDTARDARVDALARPADMVRTRTDRGATVTMGREPFARIEDRNLLDKEKLWPFINEAALLVALRSWAKTTGHSQQMPGAEVGFRNKTQVR